MLSIANTIQSVYKSTAPPMWRSRQLLYVYLSQYNLQFEPVLLLCEDLKEFKSLNSNKSLILFCPTRPSVLHRPGGANEEEGGVTDATPVPLSW